MKVRYLVSASGVRGSGHAPDDVREVTPELAKRLIARGFAEPVASRDRQTTTSRKAQGAEKRTSAKKPTSKHKPRKTASKNKRTKATLKGEGATKDG